MAMNGTIVNFILIFLSVVSLQFSVLHSVNAQPQDEEFTEELLLKPLPDRKVVAHFHFTNKAPPTQIHGRHHRLFPKAISQLVQKFSIREMELSFTQGRWNFERWGGFDPLASENAKPPGVELWAIFDVPIEQIDATWRNLTHALSGLFCASVNFLESSTAYAAPAWSFRPDLIKDDSQIYDAKPMTTSGQTRRSSSRLRYGALPREAVCTENLTPWLKLLPCRDKAGLAALMDRPSIYKAFYHSQRLHVLSSEFNSKKTDRQYEGTVLQQTLTLVLQPGKAHNMANVNRLLIQPSWSISSLFGRRLTGQCLLAKSSSVFLELESTLVEKLESVRKEKSKSSGSDSVSSFITMNDPSFDLVTAPDRVLKGVIVSETDAGIPGSSIMFEFLVDKYNESHPLNVGLTWKLPLFWSSLRAPFHASRFLMGSGNARGSIAISLKAEESQKKLWGGGIASALSSLHGCTRNLLVFQVVPWYIRLYFHTLRVYVDGQPKPMWDVVKKMWASPSEDRKSPGVLEMEIEIPCNTSSAVLTVNFEKGFLRIDEYPPDANQGFDLPSTHISFPNFQARRSYLKEQSPNASPLLLDLLSRKPVQLYTEVLLVPLATPDFSMPYNVITLTCTVLALYFGSLLNVLRRRIGEEERYLKNKAAVGSGRLRQLLSRFSTKFKGRTQDSTPSGPRLSKILLVVAVAVALHYYLNSK